MPNLQILAERLLMILPLDGSQIPNDTARTLLGQAVQEPIAGDIYFNVIELLESRGEIRRGRGRGGAVRRAHPRTVERVQQERPLQEHHLMPSLQRFLEMRFWRRLCLPDDAYWAVIDTSTGGAQNGQWRRGDFTGVAIAPRAVLNGSDVELHTFELKAAEAGNVAAVHEAYAQTRGSHYGYFVWHMPDRDAVQNRLDAVEQECQRLGVGLIVFRDPQDLDSWDRKIPAAKQITHDSEIDEFLRTRLDMREIRTIKMRLGT
jgi:hypothetical protein